MKTILFDMDGTLSLLGERRELLAEDKITWGEFFDRMGEDLPNPAVVTLYKTLWDSAKFKLVIVTARPDKYRKLTEQWLIWNAIPFGQMLMRDTKDQRPDTEVKSDMLDHLLDEGHDVLFVVDDRKSVVDMWRARGITCLQCAEFNA